MTLLVNALTVPPGAISSLTWISSTSNNSLMVNYTPVITPVCSHVPLWFSFPTFLCPKCSIIEYFIVRNIQDHWLCYFMSTFLKWRIHREQYRARQRIYKSITAHWIFTKQIHHVISIQLKEHNTSLHALLGSVVLVDYVTCLFTLRICLMSRNS